MRLIVPRIRFFSCGSKIWFLLSYQSMLVVLSFWEANVLKNAIGVPKYRNQDSVSKNEHTSFCSFCFVVIFLTELDLKLSSMYRIAFFLRVSKMRYKRPKIILWVCRNIFRLPPTQWKQARRHRNYSEWYFQKENPNSQVKKFIKTLKIFKDPQNSCGE